MKFEPAFGLSYSGSSESRVPASSHMAPLVAE